LRTATGWCETQAPGCVWKRGARRVFFALMAALFSQLNDAAA